MRALLVPKLALGALALSAIFTAPSTGVLAQGALPLKLTAFAINMNSGPKTATVDIVVNNWSTDAQRDALLAILQEQKDVYRANQALLKALQKMPKVGYIRTPERLAWDLRYARENKGEDGGRQLVVATDRPVGFAEARNQPRSMDYPFTIIEMRLNAEDKGEGKLLYGTKLYIDQKTKNLVLENYAQQPVRLNEIHPLK